MSNWKKALSIILALAMLLGVASTSAAAAVGSTAQSSTDNHELCPCYHRWPNWVQKVLYYVFFGWIWMKPCVPPLIGLDYDRTLIGDYSAEEVAVSQVNALGTNVQYAYPRFTGMEDEEKQQELNKLIYDTVI